MTARGGVHPDFVVLAGWLADEHVTADDEDALVAAIYRWYVAPQPATVTTEAPPGPHDVDLVAVLRAAHAATTRFEGGWRASSVSTAGRVVAERDGRTRLLDSVDYVVPRRRGLVPEPGDDLFVTGRLDWLDDPSGYWYAQRGPWPPEGADHLVRVYLAVEPRTVGTALAAVTAQLEGSPEHPYILKVQTLPMAQDRADAMVVYLSPAAFAHHEAGLRSRLALLDAALRPTVPRLTRALARGAAQADGPLDGGSYGDEVARRAAGAFTGLPSARRRDRAAVLDALIGAWQSAGYDPAHPYRRPSGASRDPRS